MEVLRQETENFKDVNRFADDRSPPEAATKRIYCTPRFMVFVENGKTTPWGISLSSKETDTHHLGDPGG